MSDVGLAILQLIDDRVGRSKDGMKGYESNLIRLA